MRSRVSYRFQTDSLLRVDGRKRYEWTRMFLKTEKKKLRFQKNTVACGKGLNLINPRVLKVERGLHVKMFDSVPFTVLP